MAISLIMTALALPASCLAQDRLGESNERGFQARPRGSTPPLGTVGGKGKVVGVRPGSSGSQVRILEPDGRVRSVDVNGSGGGGRSESHSGRDSDESSGGRGRGRGR